MELQRLVTGAKLENNDDFSALVRLYQRRLLISVQAVVRERTLAEDVVQEAFVRAWSGLAALRSAEALLAELGRTDRGGEFLALYGTRLELGEMIGFLNYVDRFTECRLVERLEVIAPVDAEKLKQNFFVFEDVLCFDPSALRLLFQTADRDLLAVALGGTERRVRDHVLGALTPEERPAFEAQLSQADGDRKLVRAAQEIIVTGIKALEQSGRLVFRGEGDLLRGSHVAAQGVTDDHLARPSGRKEGTEDGH